MSEFNENNVNNESSENDQTNNSYENQYTTVNYGEVEESGEIEKKGMAIASMVMGILAIVPGCCCTYLGIPLGIIAIVLSVIVLNANKGNTATKGKGFATAGLILGIIAVVLYIVMIILLLTTPLGTDFMQKYMDIYNNF